MSVRILGVVLLLATSLVACRSETIEMAPIRQALATGAGGACAVRVDRTVACWGAAGADTGAVRRVRALDRPVTLVAAGAGYCASRADGATTCDGLAIDSFDDAVLLDGGPSGDLCAASSTGAVRCWRGGSDARQISGVTASALSVGAGQACAIDGPDVVCWPLRSGRSTTVAGVRGATAVSVGTTHACALVVGGRVRCWGDNDRGQVGSGRSPRPVTAAVPVPTVVGATSLAAGARHTCAASNARLWCWGDNRHGQAGQPSRVSLSKPRRVGLVAKPVRALSAEGDLSCALDRHRLPVCWGDNDGGGLGLGRTTEASSYRPANVAGFGSTPLLPDLEPLPPKDLSIKREGDTKLLRLDNEIRNPGPGPLETAPLGAVDCDGNGDPADDRLALQRIYLDIDGDGVFGRGTDASIEARPAGCSIFHPEHKHWHFDEFATFELRYPRTGAHVTQAMKLTSCLEDVNRLDEGPSSPAEGYYVDCRSGAVQGLSVGWSDQYYAEIIGQSIEVTNVPDGEYCLVLRADPENRILETDETDNVSSVMIDLEGDSVTSTPSDCFRDLP